MLAKDSRNSIILITGSQRSGTTLLSLVLDSHPEITSIDEADFNDNQLSGYLGDYVSSGNLCFKLPQRSADIDFIRNKLDEPKVVWVVRDPRDVVASMINLHIKVNRFVSVCWASRFADVEIGNMLRWFPANILGEYKREINIYRDIEGVPSTLRQDRQVFYVAALCWKLKQITLDVYKQAGIPFYVVKYEDLICSPENTINDLLKYLELDWHDDVLRHHDLHTGMSIGSTHNDRPIDHRNTGQWRNTFGKMAHDVIQDLCDDLAKEYGYDLTWVEQQVQPGWSAA